jgi:hypothetical protein
MADSLLLSLLNLSEDSFARLPEATREALLAVLYDAWSRNDEVQELWMEALQSTQPTVTLQALRAALRAALLPTAEALHVPHGPPNHANNP